MITFRHRPIIHILPPILISRPFTNEHNIVEDIVLKPIMLGSLVSEVELRNAVVGTERKVLRSNGFPKV
jgi:hypothetical protein